MVVKTRTRSGRVSKAPERLELFEDVEDDCEICDDEDDNEDEDENDDAGENQRRRVWGDEVVEK